MKPNNICEDISKLTTIPVKALTNVKSKEMYCICEYLLESKLADEDICWIDIGIGTLGIKVMEDKSIKYKFTPNTDLAKSLELVVNRGENVLDKVIIKGLAKQFTDINKDLC